MLNEKNKAIDAQKELSNHVVLSLDAKMVVFTWMGPKIGKYKRMNSMTVNDTLELALVYILKIYSIDQKLTERDRSYHVRGIEFSPHRNEKIVTRT